MHKMQHQEYIIMVWTRPVCVIIVCGKHNRKNIIMKSTVSLCWTCTSKQEKRWEQVVLASGIWKWWCGCRKLTVCWTFAVLDCAIHCIHSQQSQYFFTGVSSRPQHPPDFYVEHVVFAHAEVSLRSNNVWCMFICMNVCTLTSPHCLLHWLGLWLQNASVWECWRHAVGDIVFHNKCIDEVENICIECGCIYLKVVEVWKCEYAIACRNFLKCMKPGLAKCGGVRHESCSTRHLLLKLDDADS